MRRCASAWRATSRRCELPLSEWWSYRPADFLMFAPRIYWRLFESLNAAFWPAQLALLAAALRWLWCSARRDADAAPRAAALALALCWLCVAWAFLWQRYAPINWAAQAFAAAFVLQAMGLLVLAGRVAAPLPAPPWRRRIGLLLLLWSLLGHPLLAWLDGRPWQQAEVFGLAPDPTALGTLGWLLMHRGDGAGPRALRRGLWTVPLLWCGISAATLAVMGSAQAWLPAAGALLALAAASRR
jgi:Family of unknown function (DUF6064)